MSTSVRAIVNAQGNGRVAAERAASAESPVHVRAVRSGSTTQKKRKRKKIRRAALPSLYGRRRVPFPYTAGGGDPALRLRIAHT